MTRKSFLQRFVPLGILLVVLVLLMPRSAKFNYDYKKGSPWPYETLIATFDFPILKTEAEMEEERDRSGAEVVPCYRYSSDVSASSIRALEGLDLGRYSRIRPTLVNSFNRIYGKGIISDAKVKVAGFYGRVADDVVMVQKGKITRNYPVSEIYKVSSARNRLLSDAADRFPEFPVDSILSKCGVYTLLVPNLEYDRALTELIHSETTDAVSPTRGYIRADQKIVSKGEIVTADIARALDSYKAEFNAVLGYDGPRILLWLGNVLLALLMILLLYLTVFYTNPAIFQERNRYYYLLTIFLISAVATFLMERLYPASVYAIPFAVITLFLRSFYKKQVVFPFYTVCLLPLLIFSGNGVELFVMNLIAGAVALFAFGYFTRGWHQFISVIIVFVSLLLTYLGFRLIDTATVFSPGRTVIYIALNSLLIIALSPLTLLFERMFDLVSVNRLRELADTNNKLILELSQKAPGTFQHSLQVASMAEAVAREIHADDLLVRVGGLYHDIGKMRNPLCFIENEPPSADYHYHDHLSSRESGRAIIRHVTDGLELAHEYRLPAVVAAFIQTHHGTSRTRYFYNQYLQEGGDPETAYDFIYPGKKPETVEQAILMICDSLEAASRTLKDFSPESLSVFVESIIDGKLKEGQLDETVMSIRDLSRAKKVLQNILAGVYHERIEYPKDNK